MSKKHLNDNEFAAGLKISSGTPGASKVLTSDGSGNATWQAAPGGGTIDAVPTNGSTNAVQSDGVFDALALKANIASPTFTTEIITPLATVTGEYTTTSPSTPSSGTIIYNRNVAGRNFQNIKDDAGYITQFGQHMAFRRTFFGMAQPGASTFNVFGMPSHTAAGTPTAKGVGTSAASRMSRLGYLSSSGAGNQAGFRVGQTGIGRETTLSFFFSIKFGFVTTTSDSIAFCGLYDSNSLVGATTATTTLLNFIGISRDSADTNLQFLHNDASGAGTKSDTGMAIDTTTGYQLIIYRPTGGAAIYMALVNLGTGAVVEYTASTNLPAASGTSYYIHLQVSNNATASAVESFVSDYYGELHY